MDWRRLPRRTTLFPPATPAPERIAVHALGLKDELSEACRRWDNRGRRLAGTGSCYLLVATLAGGGRLEAAAGAVPAPPGSLLAMRIPGPTAYGIDPAQGRWTRCWLACGGTWAATMLEPLLAARGGVWTCSASALEALLACYAGALHGADGLAADCLRFLLALEGPPSARGSDPAARAAACLEARFTEPGLGLRDLAAAAGCSVRQLQRLYRAAHGRSPAADLVERRLREAHRRLAWSADPVAVIARQVGFGSAAHFANSFRRRFGLPPSAMPRWSRMQPPAG